MIVAAIAAIVVLMSQKLINSSKIKIIRKKEFKDRCPHEDTVVYVCNVIKLNWREFMARLVFCFIPVVGLVFAVSATIMYIIWCSKILINLNCKLYSKLDKEIFGD